MFGFASSTCSCGDLDRGEAANREDLAGERKIRKPLDPKDTKTFRMRTQKIRKPFLIQIYYGGRPPRGVPRSRITPLAFFSTSQLQPTTNTADGNNDEEIEETT
jgi:hypothetical protein